jgi:hypothetical protein
MKDLTLTYLKRLFPELPESSLQMYINTPKSSPYTKIEESMTPEQQSEVFPETWKEATSVKDIVKELTEELCSYMEQQGIHIAPLPEIIYKEDIQNSKDPLGLTAYYDPTKKQVVLYITDRHPKDILRSLAHELIHHNQNLEGRLPVFNTSNVNEDQNLEEIEKEAYLQGNISFRKWENNRKEVSNTNKNS